MAKKKVFIKTPKIKAKSAKKYESIRDDMIELLESARQTSARAVNLLMTKCYWEIGRRIVKFEQQGKARAEYGEQLIERLSDDLTGRFGRGFGRRNLFQMRSFYLSFPQKVQTASALSSVQFPLPWSHYVRLLSVENPMAQDFYNKEALHGGWSVRQLDRQIESQFYERTAMSRNKVALLKKGSKKISTDILTAEEEIKDPFVLEFLNLKDEYSENDLEEALIHQLENFLLELGGDFAFIGRQRRLRVGDEWYRVDLVFFHRKLRCLVIVDLKLGKFTHADAGQMHLYLNYAWEHWTLGDENPPVGLILCAEKNNSVAKYALEGLSNQVLAAQYRTTLPKENQIIAAINHGRKQLENNKNRRKKFE